MANYNTSRPLYDTAESFKFNSDYGPFWSDNPNSPIYAPPNQPPAYDFFGTPVDIPFGIGAGPLVGPSFMQAALNRGFSIVTFKSVRTREHPCHPMPNLLPVESGSLDPSSGEPISTAEWFSPLLSAANSFGIPSPGPEDWQPRLRDSLSLASASRGSAVLAAFQGTDRGEGGMRAFIDDHVEGVQLLGAAGAKVVEVNFSCPDEGRDELLCFDPLGAGMIVEEVRAAVPDIKLLAKVAYFRDDDLLLDFVKHVGPHVDGVTAINSVATRVVDAAGNPAFPGKGREVAGVSGYPIRHLGLDMVQRLSALRADLGFDYKIIGLGGVLKATDFWAYRNCGADVVMSVTGAMWNPRLAVEIRDSLNGQVTEL